jgi:hypothetical protein
LRPQRASNVERKKSQKTFEAIGCLLNQLLLRGRPRPAMTSERPVQNKDDVMDRRKISRQDLKYI